MLIQLKQEALLPPLLKFQISHSRIYGIDLLYIILSLFWRLIVEDVLSKNNISILSAGDFP